MKKILASLLFACCTLFNLQAQPLSGSFTDCNNQTEDIHATLGQGYALIIAHKGVDCSICVSQAPGLESWASQNSNRVKVWCALTWKYSASSFSNQCQETNNWISTHNWSSIFTFPDSNRVFNNIATPTYYVYSPRDSTIKYQGTNRNTAYSTALQESIVGIQDQQLKDDISWIITNVKLEVNNTSANVIQLRLVDLSGRLVREAVVRPGANSIDLNAFNTGIYLMQFQTAEGAYSEKFYLREW